MTMYHSAALAAVALMLLTGSAVGQSFPTKSVRIVVPFPPGGTSDLVARLVAQRLAARMEQPFVVENRAGAGGMVGSDVVAKAAPDGYTLLLAAAGPLAIGPRLYSKYPFDPVRDFSYISLIAVVPNLVAINAKLPVQDLKSLVAYAKDNPRKLTFASAGTGSSSHLGGELFAKLTGLNLLHVPYKGSGPGLMATVSGEAQLLIDNMPSTLPHVRSGALRALAIASDRRSPAAPDIPTTTEAGLPALKVTAWMGIAGPAGTRAGVVQVIRDNIREALAEPETRRMLQELGADVDVRGPQEFAQVVVDDLQRWGLLIKEIGIKVE